MNNQAYNDELRLIRALRRMGATRIELPLISVTFPESPKSEEPREQPSGILVIPEVTRPAPLLELESPPTEEELRRLEMEQLIRETVG